MSKRKLSVKTLNKKCKTPRDIKKMFSNKETFLKSKPHLKQPRRSLKIKKSIWKGRNATGYCKRLTNVNKYK